MTTTTAIRNSSMLSAVRRPLQAVSRRPPLFRGMADSAAATTGPPAAYSTGVQFFHWTMGFSMAGAVVTVLLAQDTPKEEKEKKTRYMFLHKSWYVIGL